MIKFIQINLGRGRNAHDLLDDFSSKYNPGVMILSEPNKKISGEKNYLLDQRQDAALVILDRNIKVGKTFSERGFVGVETEDCIIISVYISPNVPHSEAVDVLDMMEQYIAGTAKHLIIAGDFNAKSKEWGSVREDNRGRTILEWMGAWDLYAVNRGQTPTFLRGAQSSHIDITMCSSQTLVMMQHWLVHEKEYSGSDHLYITFDWAAPDVHEDCVQVLGWKLESEIQKENFSRIFREQCHGKDIETAEELEKVLKNTCDTTLPKKRRFKSQHKPVYWWSWEINEIRKSCLKKRRIFTRVCRTTSQIERKEAARRDLKAVKKELKFAIKTAKRNAWMRLCEDVEQDTWGLGYRIATKKMCTRPTKLTTAQERVVLSTLFPQVEETFWEQTTVMPEEIDDISLEELGEALLSFKSKKAPGPDGVSPEILKLAGLTSPEVLLKVYNRVIRTGLFPKVWKIARVVLISKPGKPEFSPSSYRPLCLLNTPGKLFESILTKRVQERLGDAGLSNQQYGFRAGRSTVDAIKAVYTIAETERNKSRHTRKLCLLITVDIRNAFGTAPWSDIINAMEREKGLPAYMIRLVKSYFKDRCLITPNGEKMTMSAGVPTGSVIAPTLWNIFYDGILHLQMPEGVTLIGYADDLAVVVVAKSESGIEIAANNALLDIGSWLRGHGLQLAPEKTEATLLIGRKRCGPLNITVGEVRLDIKKKLKYLGVIMDQSMTFRPHVEYTTAKAAAQAGALVRLMPRQGGARQQKRKLLYSVVESTILYAAPIWCRVAQVESYRNVLVRVQRNMLLRITSAYKTASTTALQVVAGIIPIQFMIEERAETYGQDKDFKITYREITLRKWAAHWRTATTGRWTHQLIPDIIFWLHRKHGETDFRLTQALTGHGCFNAYLHRFKRRDSPTCRYCEFEDTAAHTLFICAKWFQLRIEAETALGEPLTEESLVRLMLSNREAWNLIACFVNKVIKTKEEDERREERERAASEST